MHLPDDFGLSPVQTLAHVGDATASPLHQHFWSTWQGAVFSSTPRLTARLGKAHDPSDPSADHEFESLSHVRVGCRLVMPPAGTAVRAGMVLLHGYGATPSLSADAERMAPLAARGTAVLCVRVRGYPGSRVDVPAWSEEPRGYISIGLDAFHGKSEQLMDWSLTRAASDVVNACRALRERIGPGLPIGITGESFGGGLAVIAASQLSGKDDLARLVIALPSLGEWRWRLRNRTAPGSAGRHAMEAINAIAKGHSEREHQLQDALRVGDALVHASKVRTPALGMLAERDEAVPAPAAAGVFNALAADPGQKWRFVTPVGHHDSGLRNARRHALFQRCAIDFMDFSRSFDSMMRPWESVLAAGERAPEGVHP